MKKRPTLEEKRPTLEENGSKMEENISPHAHAEAKNIKRAEGCVRKQKKIFLKRTEIQKKKKPKHYFQKEQRFGVASKSVSDVCSDFCFLCCS